MTQPDIYTIEARRWAGAAYRANSMNYKAQSIEEGEEDNNAFVAGYAATLRELNWQPPVDPDLIEARKIAVEQRRQDRSDDVQRAVLNGLWDDEYVVRSALAAIKRGRELERGA